jgi:hypothetical protein
VAAFSLQNIGSQASTETSTTFSVSFPPSPQVGDVFFLVCRSMSGTAATFTPDSAFEPEEIGARLTVDINDPASSRPIGTLQAFWWVHDGTGTSISVSTSVTGSFRLLGQIFSYRGSGTAALAGTPVDATAAASSTFTGPNFVVLSGGVTAINISFTAAVSGTLTVTNSQGWTRQSVLATTPAGLWFDITGSATTYTSPTVQSGFLRPWLCKVWGLGNPPTSGWSVGQIKY